MIGEPLKVREFLDQIERDQVLLPEIQRTYVWKGPQVAKLIDSLYREYPAGQILLWDPLGLELPVTKRMEGAKGAQLPSAGPPKIVLDGQQRLTSLWKALGNGSAEDQIDVYFNVETEQFQLYLRRMKADPHWVPVRAVLNGETDDLDFLDAIQKAGGPSPRDPQGKVFRDRLAQLRDIAKYKFPIEIFRSEDYDQVTELFVRINSGGTRLREAELALAKLALRLPGAITEQFEEAMDEYEGKFDYALDARFLIRALIVLGTRQSRFRYISEFWERPASELLATWKSTRRAVDAAVNFARKNARFDTSEWLPSANALIPLVVYFDRFQRIAPDTDDLLRWFYVASLRGRYSGSSETAMDEDIKAALGDRPIEELMKTATGGLSTTVSPEEFDDAGRLNPLFSLTYAVARKRAAKDWFTGIPIGKDVVGTAQKVEFHHIFAKAVLRGKASRKDRDEIANLAFLSAKPNKTISARPPGEYLPEIAGKHVDRLEAQCIPMNPELWRVERFQDFLAERRALLSAAVNDLIATP